MTASMPLHLQKENICPLSQLHHHALASLDPLRKRRSPLPPDFPRSPLQDITRHILFTGPATALNSLQLFLHDQDAEPASESRSKRFKFDPEIRVSETAEQQIRVPEIVMPETDAFLTVELETSGLDSADRERELEIQSECCEENAALSPFSSSPQVESSSASSPARNGSKPKRILSPQNAMNRKRRQATISANSSSSSFLMASSNVQKQKANTKSSILKFR